MSLLPMVMLHPPPLPCVIGADSPLCSEAVCQCGIIWVWGGRGGWGIKPLILSGDHPTHPSTHSHNYSEEKITPSPIPPFLLLLSILLLWFCPLHLPSPPPSQNFEYAHIWSLFCLYVWGLPSHFITIYIFAGPNRAGLHEASQVLSVHVSHMTM